MVDYLIPQHIKSSHPYILAKSSLKLFVVGKRQKAGAYISHVCKNAPKAERAAKRLRGVVLPLVPGVPSATLPKSPVSHLLNSNDVPSAEDAHKTQITIEAAGKEYQRLQDKFSEANGVGLSKRRWRRTLLWKAAMQRKISQVEDFIRTHETVLSPCKRLPIEILQEIFSWITLPTKQRIFSQWPTLQDIPFYVGQVCSFWRSAALKTPLLWNLLPVFVLNIRDTLRTTAQLLLLDELLRRTGAESALDFMLYTSDGDQDIRLCYHHAVLERLVQLSSRWRTAVLNLRLNLFKSIQGIIGRLDILETLRLRIHPPLPTLPPNHQKITFFSAAPSLRAVGLEGLPARFLDLPYAQLNVYDESQMASNILTYVVQHSFHHLISLSLSDIPVTPPITFPHLFSLKITISSLFSTFNFQSLILPSLTHLYVLSCLDEAFLGCISLLISSAEARDDRECPLQEFAYRDAVLRSPTIEPGLLTQLLQATPRLDSLTVPLPLIEDIRRLSYSDVCIVPRLTSCRFLIQPNHDLPDEYVYPLNQFAHSRCESHPLRHTSAPMSLVGEICDSIPMNLSLYFTEPTNYHAPSASARLNSYHTLYPISYLTGNRRRPLIPGLENLKDQLLEEFPWLRSGRDPEWCDTINRDSIKAFGRQLEQVASGSQAESLSYQDVFGPGLHIVLRDLAACTSPAVSKLSSISRNILRIWEPLLQKGSPSQKWALQGQNSVLYIPVHDPIRRNQNAQDLAFSLPAVPNEEVDWSVNVMPRFNTTVYH